MGKIKRLGCALVLIGITAMMVRSQDTAGEYVTPSEAVPRGKAPKMQVQMLTAEEPTKQYAVIFYQGDEAFPDCWSLRRSITSRVRISPRSER
jgi:hypothetical protein